MDDKLNYFGATIFWLYIVAALYISTLVIYTIISIDQSQGKGRQQQRKNDAAIFGSLAAISFATLTVNMLNVLIQSYREWSMDHNMEPSLSLQQIWHWSITSTLFTDFGEAIVENSVRYLWSQTALFVTLSVCLFMGMEGIRRQVPHLAAFFCLSQILPISFTQNLLYLALSRMPDRQTRTTRIPSKCLICLVVSYSGILLLAPSVAGTSMLLAVVTMARVLLFSPLLIVAAVSSGERDNNMAWDRMLRGSAAQTIVAVAALICTSHQGYHALEDTSSLKNVSVALFEHPAVASLGCDLLISVLSFMVWTYRGSSTSFNRAKMS